MALSKFGQVVAGAPETDKGGCIFLLPDVGDKSSFLLASLREAFPEISPHLFPDAARGLWVDKRRQPVFRIL